MTKMYVCMTPANVWCTCLRWLCSPSCKRLVHLSVSVPSCMNRRVSERQEAVRELSSSETPSLSLLKEAVTKLPDLEKMLCSAYHKKVCVCVHVCMHACVHACVCAYERERERCVCAHSPPCSVLPRSFTQWCQRWCGYRGSSTPSQKWPLMTSTQGWCNRLSKRCVHVQTDQSQSSIHYPDRKCILLNCSSLKTYHLRKHFHQNGLHLLSYFCVEVCQCLSAHLSVLPSLSIPPVQL